MAGILAMNGGRTAGVGMIVVALPPGGVAPSRDFPLVTHELDHSDHRGRVLGTRSRRPRRREDESNRADRGSLDWANSAERHRVR
jgi:hypothetical protein